MLWLNYVFNSSTLWLYFLFVVVLICSQYTVSPSIHVAWFDNTNCPMTCCQFWYDSSFFKPMALRAMFFKVVDMEFYGFFSQCFTRFLSFIQIDGNKLHDAGLFIWRNLGFSVLLKEMSTHRQEKMWTELPTLDQWVTCSTCWCTATRLSSQLMVFVSGFYLTVTSPLWKFNADSGLTRQEVQKCCSTYVNTRFMQS